MTRAIAAAGAAVLLASLWLPFYGGGVEGAYFTRNAGAPLEAGGDGSGAGGVSAWQTWTVLDAAVAVLAVIVVLSVVRRAAWLAAGASVAAVAIVAARIEWPPSPFADDAVLFGALDRLGALGFEPAWGAWVALGAALVTGVAAVVGARRGAWAPGAAARTA